MVKFFILKINLMEKEYNVIILLHKSNILQETQKIIRIFILRKLMK
jgi:hypothetical protein